jgi:hypothetical protein
LTYPATGLTSLAGPGVSPPLAGEGPGERSFACAGLWPTPYATLVYGALTINGVPAPAGTRVEVLTPRDEVAGCFVVEQAGQYGLMHVYGADPTAAPPIPGFKEGEPLRFRVHGVEVAPPEPLAWQDEKAPHRVNLVVEVERPYRVYLPLLGTP